MSIVASDIKFLKSTTITDTDSNGGVLSEVEVVSGVRHNLFPRVSRSEREVGVTRYRKEFWKNHNAADDIAYGMLVYFECITNAGDRFALGKGTQEDVQSQMLADLPDWVGCGQLETALSGGETSVSITMESADVVFLNGGLLHIADKYHTGQTVDSDVVAGDSVADDFRLGVLAEYSSTQIGCLVVGDQVAGD